MNLSHTLFRTARRVPRAVAVIERDRIELTYEQLARRVLRLARGLEGLGVKRGGRVALLAKNCGAYIEVLYACWTLGAAAIPINARLHPKEVAFILDDAEARVCFVTDDAEAGAIEAARLAGSTRFVDVDGPEYAALLDAEPLSATTPGNATDAGVALLHQRDHRPAEGRGADARQPDGDDAELPGRRRPRGRRRSPAARGADVARLGPLRDSEHRGRRNPPDPRGTRIRPGRDPPGARVDSERQVLRCADDGDAPRRRHRLGRRRRRT